ncbi:hypothetical protein [Dactylosporangium sp. CA-139066]|uniref:hypothetical protein n=1 Tax=Dactylosporangium sp. CA-139066 TaxID=3239930 RepID=UPI003D8C26E8
MLNLFLADTAAQSGDAPQAVDLARHALLSTMHQPILPILQQSRRVRRLVQRKAPAEAELLSETVEEFSHALAATAAKANV